MGNLIMITHYGIIIMILISHCKFAIKRANSHKHSFISTVGHEYMEIKSLTESYTLSFAVRTQYDKIVCLFPKTK